MIESTRILMIIFKLFLLSIIISAQPAKEIIPSIGGLLENSDQYIPQNQIKGDISFFERDWKTIIDETWGVGLPTNEKLRIFDQVWKVIDEEFAAFHNLNYNLDSIKIKYRPEIESGVSRGRFAGIMNHFLFGLKESHTRIVDIPVSYHTQLKPGTPIMVTDTRWDNSHFGACLTPLPDSSLLVYKVKPNHRLGLEIGDIILGYEGVPWKDLYKLLIQMEFPLKQYTCVGSNESSYTHYLLQSAGMNWHLFKTIDIAKINGDTLHLSTSRLTPKDGLFFGTEQLPVKGLDIPFYHLDEYITYGLVEGTDIGYIYVNNWLPDIEKNISQKFYEAVSAIMNDYKTSGLIIDYRLNHGGYMPVAHRGYSLLFNKKVQSVAYEVRGLRNDHFSMMPHSIYTPELFTIPGDHYSYYDKPIAVLSGPGANSNGDWEIYRTGLHPNAKTFGKPSNGGYSSLLFVDLGNSDWMFNYTYGVGFIIDGHISLSHYINEVDEEVWLTKDGVLKGEDDVVLAAINWINKSTTSSFQNSEDYLYSYSLSENYPNPFNPETTISYSLPHREFVTIKVFDVLGNLVDILVEEYRSAGSHKIKFYKDDLSSGIYIYQIRSGNFFDSKKMILLK